MIHSKLEALIIGHLRYIAGTLQSLAGTRCQEIYLYLIPNRNGSMNTTKIVHAT
jgi:hypothetical protein